MRETSQQPESSRRMDQIVRLAAEGLTDKQIAVKLDISKHTVDTYWARLREKLGVPNRTAAVMACLRETIEQQNQQLREAHEAFKRLHETSQIGMSSLLADTQRRLTELQGRDRHLDFWERASHIAHAVAYELSSVDPVAYRYLSPSAKQFGFDIHSLQQATSTFYDNIYPEDLPLIYEKSLGAQWLPNERYVYTYRFKMPEPRWVLDTHQAYHYDEGQMLGVIGIAIDVHELVLAGYIAPVVTRIVIPAEPAT